MKKAIVLLSGGIDSATALYIAKRRGYQCRCLIVDYGQKHRKEVEAAKRIARHAACPFHVIKIKLPWGGSSLIEKRVRIPSHARLPAKPIPSTYVPARNTIFLGFALSYAESQNASVIVIGAHVQDYSGYPDCRPAYFTAYQRVIARGTKAGVTGMRITIGTPLLKKSKSEIVTLGTGLGVPYHLAWSCYRGGRQPCGKCDSCRYRAKGFREAGLKDPFYDNGKRH
jgi:7-cyano-7-deazaguanine synthase